MVLIYRYKEGCLYESKKPQTQRWASFQTKEVFFCHGLDGLMTNRCLLCGR